MWVDVNNKKGTTRMVGASGKTYGDLTILALAGENDFLSDGISVYTPSAAEVEKATRRSKVSEIREEGLSRINAVLPDIDSFEDITLLKRFAPAFTLSANGTLAKDIYVYARTKINQAQTAPIGQVGSYDPTTDPGWPT